MRFSLAATALLLATVQLAAADGAQATVRKSTNIPAEPLGIALQTLAKERGFQVAYVSDEVDRQRTQGASGHLTVDEALTQVLRGTGLTFRHVADNGVSILPAGTPAGSPSSPPSEGPSTQKREPVSRGKAERSFPGPFRMAQVDHGQAADSSSIEAKEQSSGLLEEVIVTAEKRSERVQDVPISMSVVTAADIDHRRLFNAEDYLRGIPGVNEVDSAQGQSIIIRGMETSPLNQNFGAGVTTATYFGETPTTNTAGLGNGTNVDLKLVDVERVEVLRGPQGTAFGDSSMGGAVRTIPVAPSVAGFEAKVAAGYSNTQGTGGNNYNAQATVNMPLVADRLALRAVGYEYKDSGYYRNLAGTDPAFQAASVIPYSAQAYAVDRDNVGAANVYGGRVAALYEATQDLKFQLSYLVQRDEQDGMAVSSSSGTYDQTMFEVAPEHYVRGQAEGASDLNIDILNATMSYNVGWADLVATYSRTKSGSVLSAPYQLFGRPWALSYYANSPHAEDVGEIRLASHTDTAWNFLVGLFDENVRDSADFNYLWFGSPATDILAPGFRYAGDYQDYRDLKQRAAFGEVYWTLLPGVTLTGGLRYYHYDRTDEVIESGPEFGAGATTYDAAGASGTTPRVNLSYKVAKEALLYAGYSEGFRLGKPQSGVPTSVCDKNADGIVDGTDISVASTSQVNSDRVKSFEFGAKLDLLQSRLRVDADVFRMNWYGLPVSVIAGSATTGCGFVYVTNAGAARSDGVELQANLRIAGAVRVEFGGSFTDAKLTADVPVQHFRAGQRLPGSPKADANAGVELDFGMAGHKAFVRADSVYVGPFWGDIPESPTLKAGNYVKLDLSGRIEFGRLNLDVFIRNATNRDAFTFRGAQPRVGPYFGYRLRPRTTGLQVSYEF